MATGKSYLISRYIKALLESNQQTLEIDKIFYGDQRILTAGRIVCIEPTKQVMNVATLGHQMQTDMETGIIIYETGDVGNELVQDRADEVLEAIKEIINIDASPVSLGLGGTQLGGNITKGWCTSGEFGYRIPGSQITRANRLLFTSMSRTSLVES